MFDLLPHDFHTLKSGDKMRFVILPAMGEERGTLLVAPGRREFIEKKHAEIGSFFQQAGFRIIYFEWRGQGLSSRYLSGPHRQRDHVQSFDQHLDDLRSFYASVVLPRANTPLTLFAHSLGGHLTTRWLAEDKPADIGRAILTSPMLALGSGFIHGLGHILSWVADKSSHAQSYALANHDYNENDKRFDHNPLCHDPQRFALMEEYFTRHPDMVVGGVTWGWLGAALHSIDQLHRHNYLSRINVPVLAFSGERDVVTPAQEVTALLKHIPNRQIEIVRGALHDLMSEADSYRNPIIEKISAFLNAQAARPHSSVTAPSAVIANPA